MSTPSTGLSLTPPTSATATARAKDHTFKMSTKFSSCPHISHFGPRLHQTENQSNRRRSLFDWSSPSDYLLQRYMHRDLVCEVCFFQGKTTSQRVNSPSIFPTCEVRHTDQAEWPSLIVASTSQSFLPHRWQSVDEHGVHNNALKNDPKCVKNY